MILISIILAWFGLCFGSFAGALVWRIHQGKDWVRERSQCEHCGHALGAKDLIPFVSWAMLRGRCRYCRKNIGWEPFLIETGGGAVFVLSYLLWPAALDTGQLLLLGTWLACSVGLMALFVYDLKWMLLPSGIIYTTAAVAAAGRLAYIVGFEPDKPHALVLWLLSLGVSSGIFWLIYMVNERYIGYGDIRLGLVTGTLLATPAKSFLMVFLASVLGTLIMVPALAAGSKDWRSKLPYGPFLILATAIIVIFGQNIINWYTRLYI